jgi:hypothetical protein
MAVIDAPGGWGWPPGLNIAQVELSDLPDLPLTDVDGRTKMRLLREALPSFPHGTTPKMVAQRYALTPQAVFDLMQRKDRKKPASNHRPGATQ